MLKPWREQANDLTSEGLHVERVLLVDAGAEPWFVILARLGWWRWKQLAVALAVALGFVGAAVIGHWMPVWSLLTLNTLLPS